MITAVVLSHNNENSIERTLTSLEWCDEIVVVDDYSEDATAEKARVHKARIINRHLKKNFAQQRNFALEQAKGDWVFFVDSDEVVPPALVSEIQQKLPSTQVKGFFVKRQDIVFGKKLLFGETAHVRLLRLARKDAGTWERVVHEVWNITGSTETLTTPLEHYPHQTMTEFIDDVNHYSTANAQLMFKEGKRVTWVSIVCYPFGKFIQNYFLRQGFRDGVPGALLAGMMSFHSFLTRGKLYALQQKSKSHET